MKDNIERFSPEPSQGLSEDQVAARVRDGLVNRGTDVKTKSYGRILRDNLCTLFNLMNFALAALVILVGSYKNATFILIITANILIGTIQEIRAKRAVSKLSLISAPTIQVIRGGRQKQIQTEELVLDDIFLAKTGGQICADAIVAEGECEVNESLLTGEADPVLKQAGDRLFSGSFVVSGTCKARVDAVGKDNYAAKITADAKKIKRHHSEILSSLNAIIKTVSVVIIPIGLLLFAKDYWLLSSSIEDSVVNTVAALIGMIPEGLILLTSVVLAVGVIRLTSHKTLVQEIYCIESLARVDVLCLDKTGTITEGRMQVMEAIPLSSQWDLRDALRRITLTMEDTSPTFLAAKEYAGEGTLPTQPERVIPFSSARKYSGAVYGDGTFAMGAAGFVLKRVPEELEEKIAHYSGQGNRVVILAHGSGMAEGNMLPDDMEAIGLLLIRDTVRKEAPEVLQFFREQGVQVKLISGDDPKTVASIGKEAGLEDAGRALDVSTLTDEELTTAAESYTVFGRVSPQQKRVLIRALKEKGHTVAMTGDGVNDVLAMKDSDCSIAIAAGSDAARNVANLVLLDSNFASLYYVVMEGRRAINNIQRSASLFLVKTIFSFILSLLFLFVPASYPFQPIQLTLISSVTVGIPSFFLALQPNRDRIQGKFLFNILKRAIPGALTIVINICVLLIASLFLPMSEEQLSTLATLTTGFTALCVLAKVSMPFNLYRVILFILMTAAFAVGVLFFGWFFMLVPLNTALYILLGVMLVYIIPLVTLLEKTVAGIDKFLSGKIKLLEQRKQD